MERKVIRFWSIVNPRNLHESTRCITSSPIKTSSINTDPLQENTIYLVFFGVQAQFVSFGPSFYSP